MTKPVAQMDKKNPNKIKKRLKNQEKVVDSINKMTRIRILILLWAYGEQSINDLCEKLDKSWPTINKHLGILEESEILDVREVKSRGPKNKKLYSVKPELIPKTRLGFDFLNLPPEDVKEILLRDIKADVKTLEIIKKVFNDLPDYHAELVRNLKAMDTERDILKNFYLKKHVNYYVETLSDKEFSDYYFERFTEFMDDLEDYRKKHKIDEDLNSSEKPYIAFHIILPIKKIQEARFRSFWNP
ncbi:MAG: hypothetical protein BAJALOKI2v1_80006 [Promethearchaeota archaeon]|nr:MAG: hypothetical protein BAJALOKI2v1_80006 [Candidatus Lokiarchaeota archaeon]